MHVSDSQPTIDQYRHSCTSLCFSHLNVHFRYGWQIITKNKVNFQISRAIYIRFCVLFCCAYIYLYFVVLFPFHFVDHFYHHSCFWTSRTWCVFEACSTTLEFIYSNLFGFRWMTGVIQCRQNSFIDFLRDFPFW